MESTKAALESERKIQMLQMQAINALWKKVSTIQSAPKEDNPSTSITTGDNAEVVKSLAQTCTMLNAQVQQLQNSMQDIMRCMSTFCQVPSIGKKTVEDGIATQTEIIAVHTPQVRLNFYHSFSFTSTFLSSRITVSYFQFPPFLASQFALYLQICNLFTVSLDF